MKIALRFLLALGALLILGCEPDKDPMNQTQGAVSPSGKYVLSVPIEPQRKNPIYKGTGVWKVTITDKNAQTLYKDEDSEMVGHLNIYWGWDAQNRVWVYNSDDGSVWCWEMTNGNWQKTAGSYENVPEFVLPPYAKRKS